MRKQADVKLPEKSYKKDNRGISLIELLVSMTILAVIGLVAGRFLELSIRLSNRTAVEAVIQEDSQAVFDYFQDAIMNAKEIYLEENQSVIFLVAGTDKVWEEDLVSGVLFYYNKNTGCLYQSRDIQVRRDESGNADPEKLKMQIEKEDYLISSRLKNVEILLESQDTDVDSGEGKRETVHVDVRLTFRYGGREYTCSSGFTTRNKVKIGKPAGLP